VRFLFVHYSVILVRIFTCSVWGDSLFFRMAESLLKQLEAPAEKLAKLTAGAAIERHATKDLSVVALISEFTGRPGDLKMREFL
jgi:hypothetical protein